MSSRLAPPRARVHVVGGALVRLPGSDSVVGHVDLIPASTSETTIAIWVVSVKAAFRIALHLAHRVCVQFHLFAPPPAAADRSGFRETLRYRAIPSIESQPVSSVRSGLAGDGRGRTHAPSVIVRPPTRWPTVAVPHCDQRERLAHPTKTGFPPTSRRVTRDLGRGGDAAPSSGVVAQGLEQDALLGSDPYQESGRRNHGENDQRHPRTRTTHSARTKRPNSVQKATFTPGCSYGRC
jgi:hypothetical protein